VLGKETPVSGARSRSDVTLDRAECEELLASRNVGRLGLLIDGHPYVIPMHYATPGGGVIVFRAALRSLLMEASLREVAFEVDDAQPKTRTGWFVTVIGVALDIAAAIVWLACLAYVWTRPRSVKASASGASGK
jgi:nitroimidazol reductase NimA-like FMN-containing flavoprotein (pyridoxamine 5'-phosphate oxidase superfamily)